VARRVVEEAGGAPSLVVLGVTPELCGLDLPAGGRVVAVDRSTDMIAAIWPGRLRDGDEAVCADWRSLPLASDSADVVLLDGGLSALPYPEGYDSANREIARVLRAGGRGVVRCFVSPDRRETLDDVFAALDRREVANFHALKWRVAMAVERDAATGVAVGGVYDALAAVWHDLDALAARTGWAVEEVRTVEAYRGVSTRYTFPSRAEYEASFERAGLRVVGVTTPGYALGERCPTYVLERAP
jgi:SAM-dependent methyltransferase